MNYVLLSWREYHELRTDAYSGVFDTLEDAREAMDAFSDEIIPVAGDEDAVALCDAFSRMAWADWEVNQSDETRRQNAAISAVARATINAARSRVDPTSSDALYMVCPGVIP